MLRIDIGRTRLPTCVTRMRSVLRFIVFLLPAVSCRSLLHVAFLDQPKHHPKRLSSCFRPLPFLVAHGSPLRSRWAAPSPRNDCSHLGARREARRRRRAADFLVARKGPSIPENREGLQKRSPAEP